MFPESKRFLNCVQIALSDVSKLLTTNLLSQLPELIVGLNARAITHSALCAITIYFFSTRTSPFGPPPDLSLSHQFKVY